MKRTSLLVVALVLAGCGSFTSKDIEKAVKLDSPPQYPHTVTVKVESFTEESSYSRDIDPKPVQGAVEAVLLKHHVFKSINADGDYTLAVAIRRFDMRPSGFTARDSAVVDWSLTPRGSTQKIWQERVNSEASATMGDALGGDKRTYLAISWTFSRNIEEAIKRLEASHVLPKP